MAEKKQRYFARLNQLLADYPRIIVVGTDNVGSTHMQKMRMSLRGEAVMLMGKNTMIRKVIRSNIEKRPELEALLPHVKYNVGFVFTKGDLSDVRKKCTSLRVEAPARVGSIAPNDVVVPAGPTGMEPTQTSFLQALNIASKINRGQVEIVNDVLLIKAGEKVLAGQAALLQKLSINPFSYGLVPTVVFDNGSVFDASLLDITDEVVLNKFLNGVKNVAAASIELGLPNALSVPVFVRNAFKNLLAVAYETNITFKKFEEFKAKAAAAPAPGTGAAAAAAAAPAAAKQEAKKEEKKKPEPEPEPEEDADMGFGLFD